MSLERAVVNCKRCHELAKNHVANKNLIFKNDQVYQARNEAMKALENAGNVSLQISGIERSNLSHDVKESLKACMSCDYKDARIADLYKSKFKEKGKEE